MALPAMVSYEYIRGVRNVEGHAVAAMVAQGIAARHGQTSGFSPCSAASSSWRPRRFPISTAWPAAGPTSSGPACAACTASKANKVKYVYYSILVAYGVWGLVALRLTPNPLFLAVASGVMMNFALAFSALHTLYVLLRLLPRELRPGWLLRAGLLCCALFYMGISAIALRQFLAGL